MQFGNAEADSCLLDPLLRKLFMGLFPGYPRLTQHPYLFISNFSIAKKNPPATIRKSKKATWEYLSYSAKKTNLSEIRIKKRRALILNYDVVNIISSGEVPLDLRLEL